MVENGIFHCLVEERKQERQKIGGEIFPLGTLFFILPIWKENEERKVLKDTLYTNTLNLSCIFFSFFSLHWAATLPLFLPFFFGATMVPVMSPFFFFLGNHVSSCHFFFSWALTLPLFIFFFLFFFF